MNAPDPDLYGPPEIGNEEDDMDDEYLFHEALVEVDDWEDDDG